MESLVNVLPSKPQPLVIRLGVSTLVMAASAFIQFVISAISAYAEFAAYFLLLPGIFAAGFLFDRGTGFYSTIVGAALSIYLGPMLERPQHLVPLLLFVAIGFAFALVSEGMRKTLDQLAASERIKDLLLRELHHRTKSNMTIMAALIRAQARSTANDEARDALIAAARRVGVMGTLQDFLRPSGSDNKIRLSDYLHEYALQMEELRADTDINIALNSDNIDVSERVALPLGIIINELVTNCFKHAFPDGRKGKIDIRIRSDGELVLEVVDDGVGCPEDRRGGTGSRLIDLMVKQLNGFIKREPGNPGCRVQVSIPLHY
jgi:two-component sensor histidine kinase